MEMRSSSEMKFHPSASENIDRVRERNSLPVTKIVWLTKGITVERWKLICPFEEDTDAEFAVIERNVNVTNWANAAQRYCKYQIRSYLTSVRAQVIGFKRAFETFVENFKHAHLSVLIQSRLTNTGGPWSLALSPPLHSSGEMDAMEGIALTIRKVGDKGRQLSCSVLIYCPEMHVENCNIFPVLSILKYNPSKTDIKFITS